MIRVLAVMITLLGLFASSLSSGTYVSGKTSCPVSGNVRVSSTSYHFSQLTVQANSGNSGTVYLGDSNVDTTKGAALPAGWSYNSTQNSGSVSPSSLYMACSNSADGVTWIGLQ